VLTLLDLVLFSHKLGNELWICLVRINLVAPARLQFFCWREDDLGLKIITSILCVYSSNPKALDSGRLRCTQKNILKSGLWCQVVKLFYFHKQLRVHMSLSVLMMLVSFGSESLNMFDVHLWCQLNHCCMLLIKSKVLGVLQAFRLNQSWSTEVSLPK
jgi:hypothetical protein